MNRLILVINPRSSGYAQIHSRIVRHLDALNLPESARQTFEIQPTNPLSNAQKMAKILRENDIVLVAGGDGTAHIATNAVYLAGKAGVKIKYTGFGNFNDYAHSFSKNHYKSALASVANPEVKARIRPLEIWVNGEFYRLAPLYATVGLTAEMAEIFESPRVRGILKRTSGRNLRLGLSLLAATRFYFKHRKNHTLAVERITLDEQTLANTVAKKPTDLVFMNGPRMARIMRARVNRHDAGHFGFGALDAGNFRTNLPFLVRGLFGKIPLARVKNVRVEFAKPSEISIQIEGEPAKINNAKTLEVRLSERVIEVL